MRPSFLSRPPPGLENTVKRQSRSTRSGSFQRERTFCVSAPQRKYSVAPLNFFLKCARVSTVYETPPLVISERDKEKKRWRLSARRRSRTRSAAGKSSLFFFSGVTCEGTKRTLSRFSSETACEASFRWPA